MPMTPISDSLSDSPWASVKVFAMIIGMALMMLFAGIAVHVWWAAGAAIASGDRLAFLGAV